MEEISERIIPAELGGGRLKLYRTPKTGGDPSTWGLLNVAALAGAKWLIVLLPEQIGFQALNRAAGLSRLRKWQDDTEINLHLKKRADLGTQKGKKKGRVCVRVHEEKEFPVAPKATGKRKERALDRLRKKKEEPPPEPAPPPSPPPASEGDKGNEEGVNIPKFAEGTSFNDALDSSFPLERIITEIEGLISAADPIFDKEGNHIGDKANFMARRDGLKMIIEYKEGKAREREKAKETAKRITFDELKGRLLKSEANCKGLEALIAQARADRAAEAKPE